MSTYLRRLAGPYLEVVSEPGVRRFYVLSVPPRLGGAMLGLGMVWLVHWATGSYAAAGVVAGVYAVTGAVVGPQVARLIDAYGQPRTVPPLLIVHAGAIVSLVAAAATDLPLAVLAAIAGAAAACGPQIPALSRARWSTVLADSPRLSTAFALESLTDEIPFVLGPILVGTLSVVVHPAAGPLAAVLLLLGAGIPFARERSTAPPPSHLPSDRDQRRNEPGALRAPGALPLLGVFVAIGLMFGSMQVSVTALAVTTGHPELAGPMYGAFSLLSMAAGIAYGTIRWRASSSARLTGALAMLAILFLPLPAVDGTALQLVAVALPGLAIAPALIAGNTLAEHLASPRTLTQTFTWLASAIAFGLAAGQALAGQATDSLSAHWGFAICPLAAAAGAILAYSGVRPRAEPG